MYDPARGEGGAAIWMKISPCCLLGECSSVQLPAGWDSHRSEETDCTARDQHAFEDGEQGVLPGWQGSVHGQIA